MSGQESNIRPLNPLSTASGVASVCLETVATRATNRFAPAQHNHRTARSEKKIREIKTSRGWRWK